MSIWGWVVCFVVGWIVISFPLAIWLGKMIKRNNL
jgi:hypothetical protein